VTRIALVPRAWRATLVVLHGLQGLATTLCVFPFASVRKKRNLVRRWSARLLSLLHVEARTIGAMTRAEGNVLIVANHVSWLDIFVINAQRPARFVAKADLAHWPLVGTLIRRSGTIFIERARRRDTRRVSDSATRALLDGDVVAVFPEGTTSDGSDLLRFHASLMQPVIDSNGRVQPVALRYRDVSGARSTAPTYGDESFAASFWRVCGERRLFVDVTAAPAFEAGAAHRRVLARIAEDAIRTALESGAVATGPGTRADRGGSPP
jgi:1-acyl-sn-glycerol-3-phosphate acyltransferase